MRSRFLSIFVSLMLLGGSVQAEEAQAYYAGVNDDAELVFVADLQSLMQAPLVVMVEQMMQMQAAEPDADPKALAMGITEHTGLTKDHLGKFVFSARNVNKLSEMEEPEKEGILESAMLMSFQFTQAVSPEQFDAWVQSQVADDEMIDEVKKTSIGDAILYTDKSDATGVAMGLLPTDGGSVIFMGAENSVTAALKAKTGQLPKNIATAETLIPSLPNLVILASPSAKMKEELIAQAQDTTNAPYIQSTDQLAFGLNISDGIKLLSGAKFQDAETASKAYGELTTFITEMQSQPVEPGPMMMLASVINNLKATDNGDQIGLTTEISPVECQQLMMMLPMLFMQQQMQQQQGGDMAPVPDGM